MTTTANLGLTLLPPGTGNPEVIINANYLLLDAGVALKWARVYHNASQSIANTTVTALAFNSEREDTDTIHSTSTNTSRLTCKTAGVYLISGIVEFASNATGVRQVQIRLNGSTVIGVGLLTANGSGTTTTQTHSQYRLAVNDYVELVVYQDSGGSLNVNSSANYSPEFAMARLGA